MMWHRLNKLTISETVPLVKSIPLIKNQYFRVVFSSINYAKNISPDNRRLFLRLKQLNEFQIGWH